MKKIGLLILVLGTMMNAIAGLGPTRVKVVWSASHSICAKLKPDEKEVLVVTSARGINIRYSLNEASSIQRMFSDDGYWYRNSIVFFDQSERYLMIRMSNGDEIILNLKTQRPIQEINRVLSEEIQETSESMIRALLHSEQAKDRITGAIHAGHLMLRDEIPRLIELLKDPVVQEAFNREEMRQINTFVVRQAAQSALRTMGEVPDEIIVKYYPKIAKLRSFQKGKVITIPNDADTVRAFHQRETQIIKEKASRRHTAPTH